MALLAHLWRGDSLQIRGVLTQVLWGFVFLSRVCQSDSLSGLCIHRLKNWLIFYSEDARVLEESQHDVYDQQYTLTRANTPSLFPWHTCNFQFSFKHLSMSSIQMLQIKYLNVHVIGVSFLECGMSICKLLWHTALASSHSHAVKQQFPCFNTELCHRN